MPIRALTQTSGGEPTIAASKAERRLGEPRAQCVSGLSESETVAFAESPPGVSRYFPAASRISADPAITAPRHD
jgi:hypothetical protein